MAAETDQQGFEHAGWVQPQRSGGFFTVGFGRRVVLVFMHLKNNAGFLRRNNGGRHEASGSYCGGRAAPASSGCCRAKRGCSPLSVFTVPVNMAKGRTQLEKSPYRVLYSTSHSSVSLWRTSPST